MKKWMAAALFAMVAATPANGQDSTVGAPCAEFPGAAQQQCLIVAQAVESAQPQIGILLAGGNPTLGTASNGGLRLGVLPRVSVGAKLNLVFVRLPDILAEQAGEAAQRVNEVAGIPAPALSGTASIGVFPGFSLAPTVGGIGSVDVLGSVSWLPFEEFGAEGFEQGAPGLSYGGGVRLGLLGESFTTPGVSVSLMYRDLGETTFGDACRSDFAFTRTDEREAYTIERGRCVGEGDAGEITFDLGNWSTRAAISKRFLGAGLTAGLGYDRFASGLQYAVHVPSSQLQENFFRVSDVELDNDRWSAFVNGSFTALFATLAVEGGWLQGTEPIDGFPSESDFDPKKGTFFGSLGVRLAF